jgi:hypothetical protein
MIRTSRALFFIALMAAAVGLAEEKKPATGTLDFPIDRAKVVEAGRAGLVVAARQVAMFYASKPDFIASIAVKGCDGKPYRYVLTRFPSKKNPDLAIYPILSAGATSYSYVHAMATDGPASLIVDQIRHPEAHTGLPLAGCHEHVKGEGWKLE